MILVVETVVKRIVTYLYNDNGTLSVVGSTDPVSRHKILEIENEEDDKIPCQSSGISVGVQDTPLELC